MPFRVPGPLAQRMRRIVTRTGIAVAVASIFVGGLCVLVGAVIGNLLKMSLLFFQTSCLCGFACVNVLLWMMLLVFSSSLPRLSTSVDTKLACWQARARDTEIADNVAFFAVPLSVCCCAIGPLVTAFFGLGLEQAHHVFFNIFSACVLLTLAWFQFIKVQHLQLYTGQKTRNVSGMRFLRFVIGTNAIAGVSILAVYHACGGPIFEYWSELVRRL